MTIRKKIIKSNKEDSFTKITKNISCNLMFETFALYAFIRSKIVREIDNDTAELIKKYYLDNKLVCIFNIAKAAAILNKSNEIIKEQIEIMLKHKWIIVHKEKNINIVEIGSFKINSGIIIEEIHAEKEQKCNCNSAKQSAKNQLSNIIKTQKTNSKNENINVKRKKGKSPSELKIYSEYKNKDVEKWNSIDFVGLYLNLFKKTYDEEDVEFMGIDYKEASYHYKIVKDLLENVISDKGKMKEYLEWAFEWLDSEEGSWFKGVSIKSIFSKSSFVLKSFLASKKENKKGKDKNKTDNTLSNNDSVKEYLKNKGKI